MGITGLGKALSKLRKPSLALFLKSLPNCFNSSLVDALGCEPETARGCLEAGGAVSGCVAENSFSASAVVPDCGMALLEVASSPCPTLWVTLVDWLPTSGAEVECNGAECECVLVAVCGDVCVAEGPTGTLEVAAGALEGSKGLGDPGPHCVAVCGSVVSAAVNCVSEPMGVLVTLLDGVVEGDPLAEICPELARMPESANEEGSFATAT